MTSAAQWRERLRLGRLMGARCRDCGRTSFVSPACCSSCGGREFVVVRLSSAANLLAFTASTTAGDASLVGLVETSDGARLMCPIADCELADLQPGMPMRLEFRRVGVDDDGLAIYGHKAVPERTGDEPPQ